MKVPVDHHTHPNGFRELTILHSFYVLKYHFMNIFQLLHNYCNALILYCTV